MKYLAALSGRLLCMHDFVAEVKLYHCMSGNEELKHDVKKYKVRLKVHLSVCTITMIHRIHLLQMNTYPMNTQQNTHKPFPAITSSYMLSPMILAFCYWTLKCEGQATK